MDTQQKLNAIRNAWIASGRELPPGRRPMTAKEFEAEFGHAPSPEQDDLFFARLFHSFDDEREPAELASALVRLIPKEDRVEGEDIPVPCPKCLSPRIWIKSGNRMTSRCYTCTARAAKTRRDYLRDRDAR